MGLNIRKKIAGANVKKYKHDLKMFMPLAITFYFFNSFLLPPGLLFTTLFTPLFVVWLFRIKSPVLHIMSIYVLTSLILFLFHNFYEVHVSEYITSSTLYLTCVIFTASTYFFLKRNRIIIEAIFDRLARLNILFVCIALISLFVAKEENFFWYKNEITELIGNFPRLRLFTTEPSAYGMLLTPLILFYFQFYFYGTINRRNFFLLATLVVALLLSLSYATIGGIFLSIFLFCLVNVIKSARLQYNRRLIMFFVFVLIVSVALFLGPLSESGVVLRVVNILEGKDTSANGRSFESYILADRIISINNPLIGLGPGQLKIIGKDIVNNFYEYIPNESTGSLEPVRIPSAMADLLSVYGYLGLFLKLIVESVLFVRTRVLQSSYRLCLFIFVFIFQFVGSNTSNVNEYFIWGLAFSGLFPDSYFKDRKLLSSVSISKIKSIYGK